MKAIDALFKIILVAFLEQVNAQTDRNNVGVSRPNISNQNLGLSAKFPAIEMLREFLNLSELIYSTGSCEDAKLRDDITCHLCESNESATKVMVVSSSLLQYVAVVYEGTIDAQQWEHDLDVKLVPFGEEPRPFSDDVLVHKGFNDSVFKFGLFEKISKTVTEVLHKHPEYQVVTTGHSLGAACSVITAVMLALNLNNTSILSYSFGCPKIGNSSWKSAVNEILNLGIWRFVYEIDIVPRLPPFQSFQHVGHTIELKEDDVARAYFLHYGDENKGYAGVPVDWESTSLSHFFLAKSDHYMENYLNYFDKKSSFDTQNYIVTEFVPSQDKRTSAGIESSRNVIVNI